MAVNHKSFRSVFVQPFHAGSHIESLRGASMLVVDDDACSLQATCQILAPAGIAVATAGNGMEAIDLLRRGSFDCVLMDVQMPVLDGLEATRQIRSDAALSDSLVLGFTSNASGAAREECFAAGMNDVIRKPADPEKLFMTLARWVEVSRFSKSLSDGARP